MTEIDKVNHSLRKDALTLLVNSHSKPHKAVSDLGVFYEGIPKLRMIELSNVDVSLQCMAKATASPLLKFW